MAMSQDSPMSRRETAVRMNSMAVRTTCFRCGAKATGFGVATVSAFSVEMRASGGAFGLGKA